MGTSCSEEDGEAGKRRELVKESFELAAKLCFGEVLGPLKVLGYGLRTLSNKYDASFQIILMNIKI